MNTARVYWNITSVLLNITGVLFKLNMNSFKLKFKRCREPRASLNEGNLEALLN